MVLKEYWPRYLQELIEFQQIANAEQPEFENAVSDVKSAADDFFLVSLSEYGCERWEKILGLSAAPGDTVQDRRDRILIKYLDQLPYTYRTLLKYLATVSEDFTVTLNENAYDLYIRIRLEGYAQRDALAATLGQMIPANLVLRLRTDIPQDDQPAIVTDGGSEALTALIASGQKLILTRAAAGSGVAQASPNTLTDLVNVENVSANLSEKELVEGSPSIMQIPVQVTNEGLESNVWIREIGVFGLDISGNEILFCYGWLDGEDSDNVLPATTFEEDADTVHIHDLAVFITNQEAAAVSVQVGVGSFVTTAQMTAYAAPVLHTQAATTINETTGETTEQVQRRQDNDIQSILEQLNTGFTGTTVTHTFVPAQLQYWKGYDGTGIPEGILDQSLNRLYL